MRRRRRRRRARSSWPLDPRTARVRARLAAHAARHDRARPDGRQHGPPPRARPGHQCVGYDVDADAVDALAGEGMAGAALARRLRRPSSTPPRHVWIMVPAAFVDATIAALAPLLDAGDTIIDGGNSWYHDDIDRAEPLAADHGIDYVDVGTSGGMYGLERGYCLMIGGPDDAVARLAPIFDTLAPGVDAAERTPERIAARRPPSTAERGWLHCGPSGAGHFVKMVHNGIEYGLMAAYAEGLNVLAKADIGARDAPRRRRDGAARRPEYYRYDLDLAADHRGVAAGLGDRQLAARPHRPGARRRPAPRRLRGPRQRLRRGPLDDRTRRSTRACRCPCCRPRCSSASARAAGPTSPTRCCRRCAPGSAGTSSGRTSTAMNDPSMTAGHQPPADALVLFGATGDLAKRKLFPALYHLVRRGELNVPVIGVARSDWTDDDFRAHARRVDRATTSRTPTSASSTTLCGRLDLVQGDYAAPTTWQSLRRHARRGAARRSPCSTWRSRRTCSRRSPRRWPRSGSTSAAASSSRSRSAATSSRPASSTTRCTRSSPRSASSASTTTSARRRSRTSSCSASPTCCSSRCGTATTCAACRSRWPSRSASRAAGSFYEARRRDPRRAAEPPPAGRRAAGDGAAGRARRRRSCRTRRPRCWRRWSRSTRACMVRGQYVGYRDEPGVDPHSTVETYVAARLQIDSWRWAGVPWYVRVGKALADAVTEAVVELREPPQLLFDEAGGPPPDRNLIRFRLGKNDGVTFALQAKTPGPAPRQPGGRPRRRLRRRARRAPGGLRAAARRRHRRLAAPLRPPGRRRGDLADRPAGARRARRDPPLLPGDLGPVGGRPGPRRRPLVRTLPGSRFSSPGCTARSGRSDMTESTRSRDGMPFEGEYEASPAGSVREQAELVRVARAGRRARRCMRHAGRSS